MDACPQPLARVRLLLVAAATSVWLDGCAQRPVTPTLAQFQQYVADGQVRYFLADSGRGGPFGHRAGAAADITAWVEKTFTKTEVDGATVYDLQSPA